MLTPVRYLALTGLALLFASCTGSNPFASWETVKDQYPTGVHARIAEKGAALYYKSPRGQKPDEVRSYGEEVTVLEAGPVFTQVLSPSGENGWMSTMALIPKRGSGGPVAVTPPEPEVAILEPVPDVSEELAVVGEEVVEEELETLVEEKPSLRDRAGGLPLLGKLFR